MVGGCGDEPEGRVWMESSEGTGYRRRIGDWGEVGDRARMGGDTGRVGMKWG